MRCRITLINLAFGLFLFLSTALFAAAPQATGHLLLEAGQAYPQNHLCDFLEPGPSYRASIFGGAKVNVPMIGAVGLGLDATYTELPVKDMEEARYRQYTWDWFFLPIGLWIFNITPGVTWVVTDIKIPDLGIEDISIRPGGIISFGVRIPIVQHVAITADIRVNGVISDHEIRADGESMNITGSTVTGLAGIMAYF